MSQPALPLANQIARWCNDAGLAAADQRHEWLDQFSNGAYRSSYDVPRHDIERLRAALALRAAFHLADA